MRILAVNERVIDLLLVEELSCSIEFVRWFWSKSCPTGIPLGTLSLDNVRVVHSLTSAGAGAGESDLVVDYILAGSPHGDRIRFLIENKINAKFTDKQPERYLSRLASFIERGECNQGWCVLIAPSAYLTSRAGCELFHVRVAYEELLVYFEQALLLPASDEQVRRHRYRQQLFQRALTKKSGGWAEDGKGTSFFTKVYDLSLSVAPELSMPKPTNKTETGWIFWKAGLEQTPHVKSNFHIKQDKGYADLQISGWGKHIAQVKDALGPTLDSGLSVELATGSAAIRVATPIFSGEGVFEDQQVLIAEALRNTLRLKKWYNFNLQKLEALGRELASHGLAR